MTGKGWTVVRAVDPDCPATRSWCGHLHGTREGADACAKSVNRSNRKRWRVCAVVRRVVPGVYGRPRTDAGWVNP